MATSLMFGRRNVHLSLPQKLQELNWAMIVLLTVIAAIGCAMLFSVAGGNFDPWASRQAVRYGISLVLLIVIALSDLRLIMWAAYPTYFLVLGMLIAVEFVGVMGMGGQRWLDFMFMRIQPSELMKVAVVLALARYYHGLNLYETRSLRHLFMPFLIIGAPAALVFKQPDLGTMLMIVVGGLSVVFLAGARMWLFITGFLGAVGSIPVVWGFLKDYQRDRVLTFLNPESDPLGAGYQILQSKIALGSGGIFGKGYLLGTQSHLNFLPEMKTDFIFTVLAEEFGLVGGLFLLGLYLIVITYAALVALGTRSVFGRLLAMGLSLTLFFYVFVNIGMVMGLLPVVGVPLPLVSYGGSAMLTVMAGFGLVLSVALHRDLSMPRSGTG